MSNETPQSSASPFQANITWSASAGLMLNIGDCPANGIWNGSSSVTITNPDGSGDMPPNPQQTYGPYSLLTVNDPFVPFSQLDISISNQPYGPTVKQSQKDAYIFISGSGQAIGLMYYIDYTPANPRSGQIGQFAHLSVMCGGFGFGKTMKEFNTAVASQGLTPTVEFDSKQWSYGNPPASNFTFDITL